MWRLGMQVRSDVAQSGSAPGDPGGCGFESHREMPSGQRLREVTRPVATKARSKPPATGARAPGRGDVQGEAMKAKAQQPKEGWGMPLNSRVAHFFGADKRSLCGRWAYMGELSAFEGPHPCIACERSLAKRTARALAR